MEKLLPFDEKQKIIFSQKPISIPSDLRPIYKMSQILLMLKCNGYKNQLSLLQIQYLNWLLKHKERVEKINLKNDSLPFDIIHIDPFINTAIEYCIGEKLIEIMSNGKFNLTDKGNIFINRVINDKVLKEDTILLKNIGSKKVSENQIKKMIVGN